MTLDSTNLSLVADYFDDLLDGPERDRAEAAIASDPSIVVRVVRMRDVLYRPSPVAPPSDELPARVVRGHRSGPRLLHYAIAFAAGVVIALLLSSGIGNSDLAPTRADVSEETIDELPTEPIIAVNRRVR